MVSCPPGWWGLSSIFSPLGRRRKERDRVQERAETRAQIAQIVGVDYDPTNLSPPARLCLSRTPSSQPVLSSLCPPTREMDDELVGGKAGRMKGGRAEGTRVKLAPKALRPYGFERIGGFIPPRG